MSYAIKNDGSAIRAVSCQADVGTDEYYSETVPSISLFKAKANQISAIYTDYQTAISQPVSFTTTGGVTKEFQADANSQDVLTKTTQGYVLAGSVPDGFYWVAADNTKVPFTLADLKGLCAAMLAQGWTAFQRLQTKKSAIYAATTVDQVGAVSW